MEDASSQLRDAAVRLAQLALDEEADPKRLLRADPEHQRRKRELAEAGALLLIRLRGEYRREALGAERARDGAAAQRQLLDSASLQLRNLLYELGHYGREVQACRGFAPSAAEEAAGLVPEEEFAAAEPEAYAAATGRGGGGGNGVGGDNGIDEGGGAAAAAPAGDASLAAAAAAERTCRDHALMLARLAHELETRKRLARRVGELGAAKARENAAVGAARSALEELQLHLRAVEGAARPLTEALAATGAGGGQPLQPLLANQPQQQQPSWALAATLRQNAARASLLPLPLYIVYAQFVAAQDALGLPVEVSISGSVMEAQQQQQRQQQQQQQAAAGALAAAPVAGGAAPRPSSGAASAAAARAIFAVHPLSVDVRVLRPGTAEQLAALTFGYYPCLRAVGASAADAEDSALLASLFPGDAGDGAGMEGLAMALAAAGVTPEAAMASAGVAAAAAAAAAAGAGGGAGGLAAVGGAAGATAAIQQQQQLLCAPYGFGGPRRQLKPYLWVQDLAGLDFVSSLPPAAFSLAGGGDGGDGRADDGGGEAAAAARGAALAALAQYRREQRVQTVVERLASAKAGAAALK